MKPSKLASVGLFALAYGGIFAMTAADGPRDRITPEQRAAQHQADEGARALTRHDAASAIVAAEQAVTLAPREAAYRLLLGQSYLQAGRFASAAQAFTDTLALDGGSGAINGKAALNLALMQVASGDWQAARRTLGSHRDTVPVSDRGLALALAGDTEGAVALLTEVVRSPQATPKARQNLALAYALGGQWQAARVVAAVDMSPADVDARMLEWAAFAQPQAASDQVAGLLGVHPVADNGLPATLALNTPAPVAAPGQAEAVQVAAAVEPAPATAAAAPQPVPVAFGAPHEVVQPIAVQPAGAPLITPPAGPSRVRVQAGSASVRTASAAPAAAHAMAGGAWFVQLGAYANAGVAHDAWGRARHRYAGFAAHQPQGVSFRRGTATFYRLSVGGFARTDADRACRAYKARGGDCFVRAGAGDQVASWARGGGVQMAAR
ncbi:SPOR domain-containing protein [Sphingomonas sp.]|uniref:SPOR domain-containing protein n=1 Tax=Sphingomonas sp. TaxID=28214 RepID=UPI003CC579C5